jgi:hypothetical protein
VVSATPRPRFAPGKGPPVPIVQEAGWVSEPVWTQRLEEKILCLLPGIEPRSPGRPARSQESILTELTRLIVNICAHDSNTCALNECGTSRVRFEGSLSGSLTPWRKNPKDLHRTHNSPPSVPVLSQSNPIRIPQANLPKIHSDPIFSPTSWSSEWSLSFGLSHQNLVCRKLDRKRDK